MRHIHDAPEEVTLAVKWRKTRGMVRETSRREFLALSGAALAATSLGGAQKPAGRLFAYVGRHTRGPGFGVGGGGGITVFSVNMGDGSLAEVSRTGPELDDLDSDN